MSRSHSAQQASEAHSDAGIDFEHATESPSSESSASKFRSDLQFWYAKEGDTQSRGPIEQKELLTLLREGHLTAKDMVWQQGWSQWLPISEVIPEDQIAPLVPEDKGRTDGHKLEKIMEKAGMAIFSVSWLRVPLPSFVICYLSKIMVSIFAGILLIGIILRHGWLITESSKIILFALALEQIGALQQSLFQVCQKQEKRGAPVQGENKSDEQAADNG